MWYIATACVCALNNIPDLQLLSQAYPALALRLENIWTDSDVQMLSSVFLSSSDHRRGTTSYTAFT